MADSNGPPPPTPPDDFPSVSLLFGPMLLGVCFSMVLYGVSVLTEWSGLVHRLSLPPIPGVAIAGGFIPSFG
ncbi:hypothetical protein BD779DRAFT_206765 [Infundibulicybe gibba]|nr:hypothetical protein BD779DRAFT_206765 [Infundibulicybe gibba]